MMLFILEEKAWYRKWFDVELERKREVIDEMKVEGNQTAFIHYLTAIYSRVLALLRPSLPQR